MPRPLPQSREYEAKIGQPDRHLVRPAGAEAARRQIRGRPDRDPHGRHFTLDRNPEPGDENRVDLPHPELFGMLQKGQRLLLDDGKLRLRVIRADENEILCSAEVGGVISDRKGVNVPDAEVPIPALTDKDRRDLAFAIAAEGRLDRPVLRAAARRIWPRRAS